MAIESFPDLAELCKPRCLPRAKCARCSRFRAGCAATPEALLLSFVPVTFDLYRTVRRHLHWTLAEPRRLRRSRRQVLAQRPHPRCHHGTPSSTVSRHLAQLAKEGVITRQRRPGGVYAYIIAARFLPAGEGCPTARKGCPTARTEEQAGKKTGYAQAQFAKSGVSFGEIPDERSKWEARLRCWRQSRFWLPLWGPQPDRAGLLRTAATALRRPLIAFELTQRRSSEPVPPEPESWSRNSCVIGVLACHAMGAATDDLHLDPGGQGNRQEPVHGVACDQGR